MWASLFGGGQTETEANEATRTQVSELPVSASQYGTLAGGMREKEARTPRKSPESRAAYWVMLFTPFVLFFTTSVALAFVYFDRPKEALAVVAGCFVVPLWFVLKVRGAQAREDLETVHHSNVLVTLTLGAVLFGTLFGYILYSRIFFTYEATTLSQTYTNVCPKQPGASLADAGKITFTSETWIDGSRSVGYHAHGRVYCLAPVIDDATTKDIEYWAIGEDCCADRGGFRCGEVSEPGHKGQKPAYQDFFPSEHFHDALKFSLALSDMTSQDGALLLRFVPDVDAYLSWLHTWGIVIFSLVQGADLLMCYLVAESVYKLG
jgi:hypothetical protein